MKNLTSFNTKNSMRVALRSQQGQNGLPAAPADSMNMVSASFGSQLQF